MSHDERPDYCILVCRTCDDEGIMPFRTQAERGRWAAQHTAGTGHKRWFCLDGWPTIVEVRQALQRHDALTRSIRG